LFHPTAKDPSHFQIAKPQSFAKSLLVNASVFAEAHLGASPASEAKQFSDVLFLTDR